MLKALLNKCIEGHTLKEQEAEQAMDFIMQGEATPSQIAGLISIMRFRGETVEELTGFVRSMRRHALSLEHEEPSLLDTCGTGGDVSSTYNISTASAIALSGAGIKVAKHGNRSVSSKSGSADVLETLQVPVQSGPEEAVKALQEKGLAFLFAPLYHVAMKHAGTPRKELGFRTIFNVLGPLTNPANADIQVVGVFDREYGEKMAYVLKNLGASRALFVTGRDGLDEMTISDSTYITELRDGEITKYEITPEEAGLTRASVEEVQVETAEESAALIESIFNGSETGAAKDILLLNMGAAFYAAGRAETIADGVQLAEEVIRGGKAEQQLQRLRGNEVKSTYA